MDEATEAIKCNLMPAIETLRQIIDDEDVTLSVRVQACRSMLDYSLKMVETNDILQRLDALERSGNNA